MKEEKKIYALEYSGEDFYECHGYFTTKEKAEEAKKEIIGRVDGDVKDFYDRELCIEQKFLDIYTMGTLDN